MKIPLWIDLLISPKNHLPRISIATYDHRQILSFLFHVHTWVCSLALFTWVLFKNTSFLNVSIAHDIAVSWFLANALHVSKDRGREVNSCAVHARFLATWNWAGRFPVKQLRLLFTEIKHKDITFTGNVAELILTRHCCTFFGKKGHLGNIFTQEIWMLVIDS